MKFPLFVRRGGVSLVLAVSLLVLPAPAQRPAPKPAPPRPQATAAADERAPSVTFDTLLSADAYGIYAELRAIGRYANSPEMEQMLAPLALEGNGAPDELLALHEFVRAHADELMTARMMFASMPTRAGLPEVLLAVEMPSVEEARKFVPELRQFVAANFAPPPPPPPGSDLILTTKTNETPESPSAARRRRRRGAPAQTTAESAAEGARARKQPAAPSFQIKRAGNLIALSEAKFTFRDLQGTERPLLVNEPGFQTARTRFSTDTLFIYFNPARMETSSKRQNEAREKEWRRQEELARAEAEKQGGRPDFGIPPGDETIAVSSGGNMNVRMDKDGNLSATVGGNMNSTNANVAVSPEDAPPPATPEATPTPKSEKELEEERRREQSERFTQTLMGLVFSGRAEAGSTWPASIGVGISLEADALVARGLFLNASAEEPLRPIPFLPLMLSGPPISPEAATVLPAGMDIFASASLDLPQIYDYLASMMKIADLAAPQEEGKGNFSDQLAAFEKANNFRIREELIAALGNEIAVGIPARQLLGSIAPAPPQSTDDNTPPTPSGPILILALNDKESLQKLLPRVLSAVGFAGATEQSVIERHGQVEVLTFSNGTLAFIDRFLVGTPDMATMRRVTDAYNSGETLANHEGFRNSTRWQSKQAIGQSYVSNALLKYMFNDIAKAIDDIDDPAARAYLTSLDPEPGAITHVVTRESDGLMHELRLPKNLLTHFAASNLVSHKLAAMRGNEFGAHWKLRQLADAQKSYKEAKGNYGTIAELIAGDFLSEENASLEIDGYEIKLSVSGDRFEATATPTGYPKLGRRSYYIDQAGILRGGDLGGKPATQSSPAID